MAYKKALDAAIVLDAVAARVRSSRPDLADQLRRAVSLIALNLAEGASEFSPAEKARFYRIARRSAAESAAALDLIERLCGVPAEDGARRLDELNAMLSALVARANAQSAR